MPDNRTGNQTRPLHSPLARVLALAVLVALGGSASGCDNGAHHDGARWPVTIDNRSGITLDVDLDGEHVATIATGTLTTVPDVFEGEHTLEAFDLDGHLVADRSFHLSREFVWVLE